VVYVKRGTIKLLHVKTAIILAKEDRKLYILVWKSNENNELETFGK
jgi:hypothetical protein